MHPLRTLPVELQELEHQARLRLGQRAQDPDDVGVGERRRDVDLVRRVAVGHRARVAEDLRGP